MLEVAAALIYNEMNEILICQRPEGKNCALLWEFPGGKQEAGETLRECLLRECHEELAIELAIEKEITDTTYSYPAFTVHLTFYRAHILSGEPKKQEHNEIRFVRLGDLRQYDFCPADAAILALLMQES
ncbi:MAG: 8-oxo-dGTP diphosphatase MutT [Negativicutes bacterium]|nr:8-oxo-dGTP diphosphatase MutT [Negativicutes bacterium]